MQRPEVPRAWRLLVAAAALYALLLPSLLPQLARAPPGGGGLVQLLMPASVVLGLSLAISMARQGEPWGALGGLGAALISALVAGTPAAFFFGVGLAVPVALLAARPDPAPTALAALAFAGLLLYARVARHATPSRRFDADEILLLGLLLALALGLALWALRARPLEDRPWSRRARLAVAWGGAALLALSIALGGHLFFVPLGPGALAMLAIPPLFRWRAWPRGAAALGILLALGAIPVGPCTVQTWSDAIGPHGPPPPYERSFPLAVVGTNGPFWREGGGFSGMRVDCPLALDLLGLAWAAGLAALGVAAARRPR